jgi:hypothetical protein
VQLQKGSLSASIIPSEVPERFAVEVGNARVAVHGTSFRVTRHEKGVTVTVQEGTVAVRKIGASIETFVSAPGVKRFYITGDDAGTAIDGPPKLREARKPRVNPPAAEKPQSAARGAPSKLSDGVLTLEGVELGVQQVEAVVGDCLRQRLSGKKPGLSLRTRMTLRVAADGQVAEQLFRPPLAPHVDACVSSGLSGVRFARSAEGSLLSRDIEVELPATTR